MKEVRLGNKNCLVKLGLCQQKTTPKSSGKHPVGVTAFICRDKVLNEKNILPPKIEISIILFIKEGLFCSTDLNWDRK